jgi:predicted nucleic acid-binding protein
VTVFVDTSAFIALLVPEDQNHAGAGNAWRELVRRDEEIVTTNYVVVEAGSILQSRFGSSALRRLVDGVLPLVTVELVDAETHTAGLDSALLSTRTGPSIVDCVSFAMMRKLGIRTAFAFDPHFGDQGFELLPD